MVRTTSTVVNAIAFATVAAALAIQPRQAASAGQCKQGVQIFTVGGSGCGDASMNSCEVGEVAQQVVQKVPNSNTTPIGYAASTDFSNYAASLNTGIPSLKQAITSYSDSCPNGKIVLMGYSQGAQVVTDTLAGDGGDGTGATPLDAKYKQNIVAVVVWADPAFNYQYGQDISKGTANGQGTDPRNQQSYNALDSYKGRLASFCDQHDQYCSPVQPINYSTHTSYFATDHYIDQSVAFVQQAIKN